MKTNAPHVCSYVRSIDRGRRCEKQAPPLDRDRHTGEKKENADACNGARPWLYNADAHVGARLLKLETIFSVDFVVRPAIERFPLPCRHPDNVDESSDDSNDSVVDTPLNRLRNGI